MGCGGRLGLVTKKALCRRTESNWRTSWPPGRPDRLVRRVPSSRTAMLRFCAVTTRDLVAASLRPKILCIAPCGASMRAPQTSATRDATARTRRRTNQRPRRRRSASPCSRTRLSTR
eukprot:Amastigsp_a682522_4.p3 type:complete len:117 gc:universal Amastigsp_a682522_4:560-210(-)